LDVLAFMSSNVRPNNKPEMLKVGPNKGMLLASSSSAAGLGLDKKVEYFTTIKIPSIGSKCH